MLKRILLIILLLISFSVMNLSKGLDAKLFSTPEKKNVLPKPEEYYGYERAIEDSGIFSANKKNGEGINIGVLDGGIPDSFEPFVSGKYYCYGNNDNIKFQAVPAASLNSVAVSASNSRHNKSVINIDERWFRDGDQKILFGPNIYAPGDGLLGTPYHSENSNSVIKGTSFSAPIVSGVAALLMDEFPKFKTDIPQLVSVLMASGNNLMKQSEIGEKDYGFGIVNYEKARKIANNSFSIRKGQTSFEEKIRLKKNEKIKVVLDYLIDGKKTTTYGEEITLFLPKNQFSFILKNNNTGEVINSLEKANYRYLEYSNIYDGDYSLQIYSNGKEKIGCSYYIDEELPTLEINNLYLDTCPSLIFKDNVKTYKTFDLIIANFRGDIIVGKYNLVSNSYTLTRDEWGKLIALRGKECYCYYVVKFNGNNLVSKPLLLNEPSDYKNMIQIKPIDWGFENQYYFESSPKSKEEKILIRDGFEIKSRRLRFAYIENSYIVLSPIRQNAGKAYLELKFNKPVYSYMFGITSWGTKEQLFTGKYSGFVEELDSNGNWTKSIDLINDISLSTNFYCVDRYGIYTKTEGICGLRFTVNGPATGNYNKGRICLDDIVFSTEYASRGFISSFYEPIGAY